MHPDWSVTISLKPVISCESHPWSNMVTITIMMIMIYINQIVGLWWFSSADHCIDTMFRIWTASLSKKYLAKTAQLYDQFLKFLVIHVSHQLVPTYKQKTYTCNLRYWIPFLTNLIGHLNSAKTIFNSFPLVFLSWDKKLRLERVLLCHFGFRKIT